MTVVDSEVACLMMTGGAEGVFPELVDLAGVLLRSGSPTCEERAVGALDAGVVAGGVAPDCCAAVCSGLAGGFGPNLERKNWLAAMAINVSAKTRSKRWKSLGSWLGLLISGIKSRA